MKAVTVYSFEDEDPNYTKAIDSAFFRLIEFAPELRNTQLVALKEVKALNRLQGNAWKEEDVFTIVNFAKTVEERARKKYTTDPCNCSPIAPAIIQACDNLLDVVKQFLDWFIAERMNEKKPKESDSQG